jgi:GT2 family glycosyltransferase
MQEIKKSSTNEIPLIQRLSKEIWNKVGDFDEKCAPMYFEDADYCKRVQKAGYKMQVEDRVDWGILHLEGERHKERRAYMKQHMAERNSIRLYVRAKHAK